MSEHEPTSRRRCQAPATRRLRGALLSGRSSSPHADLHPANTIFYATLLWLLIPGPFLLRRYIRVKRGLCPKCAYPMGESAVCSECGKAIPSRKVTAT